MSDKKHTGTEPDLRRRRLLTRMGLLGAAVYVTPALLSIKVASASDHGMRKSRPSKPSKPSRPSHPEGVSRPSKPSRPSRPSRPGGRTYR